MKIDINWELDRILLKSGLIKEISCDQAVNVVHDLEKKLMQGYKIGLYGVGLEAEGLLHFIFSHVANFKIDCCFDKTIRSFKYKRQGNRFVWLFGELYRRSLCGL